MKLFSPKSWKEYALLDSGDGEKLERFGDCILIRPEPQALWPKSLSPEEWGNQAHAKFVREQKDKYRFTEEIKGGWTKLKSIPDTWNIHYPLEDFNLTFRLALTPFGHVGIFPEQGDNWNYIFQTLKAWEVKNPRVLNLFAYTGAASVVAKKAGAEIIHVDASRPGLNWARQNMELNGLKDIRWVLEDALKFVKREVRRGHQYEGIIMDPPPYGRGPEGEKWTLQEKLDELLSLSAQLLQGKKRFFILNLYAAGLSSLIGRNMVQHHFKNEKVEWGEFFLKSNKQDLPMGTFARFSN